MKNCVRLIGNVVLIMALAFTFMACPDPDPNPNPDPDLLIGEVSQPPTDPALAGEFGVYTSGTNLVIKSGTQVYVPNTGAAAYASPYSSGSTWTFNFGIYGSGGLGVIGTASLPTNGILDTITIIAPPNAFLESVSSHFDSLLPLPAGSIKEGASTLIGTLRMRDSSYMAIDIFSSNAFFQSNNWFSGECYMYFYSKGNVTVQLPMTEIEENYYCEIDVQLKEGWNCVAVSDSEDTITLVSKNPPANARWIYCRL